MSGVGSGGDSGSKADVEFSLKHSLRFFSHSSKTKNNWFEVSPLWSAICYPIVLIGLFLDAEKRKSVNVLKYNRIIGSIPVSSFFQFR